jgi:hypothetical protein
MSMCSKQTRWLAALALALSSQSAWCADAALTLGSLVRTSQHILIGKVLSTELISARVGDRTVDCGVSAQILVLENLIGAAPEVITVGFQEGPPVGPQVSPLTGKSYFLPLAAAAKTTLGDAGTCEAKLPKLWAQQSVVTEIVQIQVSHPDHPFFMEWLQVPEALSLPGLEPAQTYPPAKYIPDSTTVAGQLMPPSLRNGARVVRWMDVRRQFCRLSEQTSGPLFCN